MFNFRRVRISPIRHILDGGMFVSEIISCVKDKEDKILSGDPDKVKKVFDTWKFSKDVRANSPNWLLIDTQI